ncbi:peroxidase family protein [Glutamicibacter soli]|uniref:peroxidase family protein n=1 Tax=Glutamicibacter soli TaxID=453836 RepID=UPI003C74B7DD
MVLAGNVGVEQAALAAGQQVEVPFTPGRVDATQEQTDVEQFAWLEPVADGFRNYDSGFLDLPSEYLLIDRANLLGLSAPEMTVLLGGLRVIGNNWDGSNLAYSPTPRRTDQRLLREPAGARPGVDPVGRRADLHHHRRPLDGSRVDSVFGSNFEPRALAEVYASDDAKEKFVKDFAAAWAKLMDADRFELARKN